MTSIQLSPSAGRRAPLSVAFCLLTLALVSGTSAAFATGPEAAELDERGRSPRDLELEDFLRHAEIVQIEDVGEGITQPKRLTLERDGVRRRAIYKDIDQEIEGMVRADKLERDFSDKYTYEVAAYRIDRLVGIGLVPVTVLREVEGKMGSVQLWIEDVTTLQKVVDNPGAEVENFDLLVERLTVMYVLDALIMNVDRNFGNVLVNIERDVFHPIDHSRAFRLSPKPPAAGGSSEVPVPERVAAKLETFELEDLQVLLGDLLDPAQVRAIVKRRDRLVKQLDKRGLLPEITRTASVKAVPIGSTTSG